MCDQALSALIEPAVCSSNFLMVLPLSTVRTYALAAGRCGMCFQITCMENGPVRSSLSACLSAYCIVSLPNAGCC